jgi:hypothetical protein
MYLGIVERICKVRTTLKNNIIALRKDLVSIPYRVRDFCPKGLSREDKKILIGIKYL